MNEDFIVGGEELYPGDSRGSAANVINCKCTHAYLKNKIIKINIFVKWKI